MCTVKLAPFVSSAARPTAEIACAFKQERERADKLNAIELNLKEIIHVLSKKSQKKCDEN